MACSAPRGAAVAGGVGGYAAFAAADSEQVATPPAGPPVEFHGEHQAGIVTPIQDRLHFAAFDLVPSASRDDLVRLLRQWTAAAEPMTAGRDVGEHGAVSGPDDAPPEDTGEAMGLPPSRLTLTIGFGTTAVRYSQLGFGRTSPTSREQTTPRNLMGFKDGTRNVKLEDTSRLDEHVWVRPGDGPDWMAGGSYLVARRIRMMIETWDRTSLAEQEAIIGRHKGSGAPLGKADEFDEIDFGIRNEAGEERFTPEAHIRLAHPSTNGGAELLRRGYNFVDGSDGLGRLDAGLFFLAYQRDPRRQFVPIQNSLARSDVLNEYIRHVGSGIFACPPGARPDTFWGESLLGG